MNLNAEVALVEILELEICSERGSACFFAPFSFSFSSSFRRLQQPGSPNHLSVLMTKAWFLCRLWGSHPWSSCAGGWIG
jgi:hypothetical protein